MAFGYSLEMTEQKVVDTLPGSAFVDFKETD
jgi:hypothetical protein